MTQRDATPEELALARKIVADRYILSDEQRASILSGGWDRTAAVRIALSAIQQTTELAAIAMEDFLDDPLLSGHGYATGAAEALRNNDHLKQDAV